MSDNGICWLTSIFISTLLSELEHIRSLCSVVAAKSEARETLYFWEHCLRDLFLWDIVIHSVEDFDTSDADSRYGGGKRQGDRFDDDGRGEMRCHTDDMLYIVMGFAEGGSLAHVQKTFGADVFPEHLVAQ
jgi:hypothetical protein